jgi:hypothetical protein
MITRKIVRRPLVSAAWIFAGAVLLHFVPSHGINRWVPIREVLELLMMTFALGSSFKLLFVIPDWIDEYRRLEVLFLYRSVWITCSMIAAFLIYSDIRY